MICIVLAENVMCLYVQMCMSILRAFIILSLVMVGWLSVCLLLLFFQFASQDMLFTALLLAWYWLPVWGFQTWKYRFYDCYFTNVEWSANLLQRCTIYMREIHISSQFSHKDTSAKRPSPASVEGIWMNVKQNDLLVAQRFLWATFHRSEPNKTHSLFFQAATERIQQNIFVLWPLTP